jgi:hypothetical protein
MVMIDTGIDEKSPFMKSGLYLSYIGFKENDRRHANPIRPHLLQSNQFPFEQGLQTPQHQTGGFPLGDDFMNSIREVAVFAWSLTGINGNVTSNGHGIPRGEAQQPWGLPVWEPFGKPSPGYNPPETQTAQTWSQLGVKSSDLGALEVSGDSCSEQSEGLDQFDGRDDVCFGLVVRNPIDLNGATRIFRQRTAKATWRSSDPFSSISSTIS